MTFTFPVEKDDFTAENGITYSWSNTHWRVKSFKGPDGQTVIVDDEPPEGGKVGQLWFCTKDNDYTLYILAELPDVWVPASPPVSLDGIDVNAAAIRELEVAINRVDNLTADLQSGLTNTVIKTDEALTGIDEKLAELDGELDDLRPSIERGEWLYNSDPDESAVPNSGEYHAQVEITDEYCKQKLGQCLIDADGDLDAASQCNRENDDCDAKIGEIDSDVPWHEVSRLVLSKSDQSGQVHSFGDVIPEMYVEAINLDGSGHGLYQISGKSISGKKCALFVSPVHSTGHPNGKAVIKIFKMVDADPSDYVKKSGDTITGRLQINRSRSGGNGNSFIIRGRVGKVETTLFKDYQREESEIDKDDYIEYFGSSISNYSICNKKQIKNLIADEYKAGLRFLRFRYIGQGDKSDTLQRGEFCRDDSHIWINHISLDGVELMEDPDKEDWWGESYWFRAYNSSAQQAILMHFKRLYFYPHSKHDYMKFSESGKVIGVSRLSAGKEYFIKIGGFI